MVWLCLIIPVEKLTCFWIVEILTNTKPTILIVRDNWSPVKKKKKLLQAKHIAHSLGRVPSCLNTQTIGLIFYNFWTSYITPCHRAARQEALLSQRDRATRLSVEILQLKNIAIVWHYLRDPTFSRFYTIPECDTHTHTQRDGWTDTRQWHVMRLS